MLIIIIIAMINKFHQLKKDFFITKKVKIKYLDYLKESHSGVFRVLKILG